MIGMAYSIGTHKMTNDNVGYDFAETDGSGDRRQVIVPDEELTYRERQTYIF